MKKLHLICNAHIDPIWQWTWDEGISAALATFKSAADLSDEFDYIFCHNESLIYEAIEKYCPELFVRVKKLIKDGKWKVMGGWYLQPDCLMPSGESIIRQIKVGHKYFQEKFGVTPEIAINFDSFGHSVGLVQILVKNGYKGYMHCRPHSYQRNYKGRFYKWTSPSGDSVTVARCNSYGVLLGEAADKIKNELKNAEDVDYVLWGVGNHGGGPSRKDLRDIINLQNDLSDVEIKHSTPEELFSDDIKISEEFFDSLVTCMAGCYSSMAKVKKSHREAENILYTTEKMLAVAMLSGYKTDLTALYDAQKRLLLAEFHDILPGTCVEDGEREGLELLSACKKVAKDYRTGAFTYLTMGQPVAKEGEFPIFVFNPMPYEVTAPIEAEMMLPSQNWSKEYRFKPVVYLNDEKIISQEIKEESTLNLDWRKKIVFEGKLKPLGVTRFSVYLEKEPFYAPYERPAREGDIVALLKNSVLPSPVALEMYQDTADPWGMSAEEQLGVGKNAQDFRLMTSDESKEFIVSKEKISPIHVIEDGDVYKAVEGFYTYNKTDAVIEYRKYKNQSYVDLKVTVEYSEKNKLVKLRIPAPSGITIGDGPYVIEQKPTNNELSFQKWVGVKKEDGQVFAIINDGVYAGKVKDGYIYLTLLRGAGYCMHPLPSDSESSILDKKLYPTDRYLPRIDNGRYVYNFRIMVGSVEEVTKMAEQFNQKAYAINVFPIGGGKPAIEISTDSPVIMPCAKTSVDGGYIFRFFNPELTEKAFTLCVAGKKQKVTMKRAEIVSVRYNGGKFTVYNDSTPI